MTDFEQFYKDKPSMTDRAVEFYKRVSATQGYLSIVDLQMFEASVRADVQAEWNEEIDRQNETIDKLESKCSESEDKIKELVERSNKQFEETTELESRCSSLADLVRIYENELALADGDDVNGKESYLECAKLKIKCSELEREKAELIKKLEEKGLHVDYLENGDGRGL